MGIMEGLTTIEKQKEAAHDAGDAGCGGGGGGKMHRVRVELPDNINIAMGIIT